MAERNDQQRCSWCGYDLHAQPDRAGQCPECGNPYDRRYARHPEYERQVRSKLHRIDYWLTLAVALFVFGMLALILFS